MWNLEKKQKYDQHFSYDYDKNKFKNDRNSGYCRK
jgi:hypothetical protein